MIKSNYLFKNVTTTAAAVISWPDIPGGLESQYNHMDVIAVIHTITGGGKVTMMIQEAFPTKIVAGAVSTIYGQGIYITTAAINGITNTGVVCATYLANNQQAWTPYSTPGTQLNALLGKGTIKQVVTTVTATITEFNADIIFVFSNS